MHTCKIELLKLLPQVLKSWKYTKMQWYLLVCLSTFTVPVITPTKNDAMLICLVGWAKGLAVFFMCDAEQRLKRTRVLLDPLEIINVT